MTTIFAASGTAVLVLLAGNLPWAGLAPIGGLLSYNLRIGTAVPWAIVPAAIYLWLYWGFISGKWGSVPSAAERKKNLRARPLSPAIWINALGAGLLGFAALAAFLALAARLVQLPAGAPISTPAGMPAATAFLLLATSSVVAGVSEEAAFRGYMQSMIERRYGLGVATLANGTLFGLLHFGNHPADVLLMLPYYIAVAAVYGGLTWATDSVLPAVVLHSVGDIVVLTRWWSTGSPEWQVRESTPALVWEHGIDAAFLLAAIMTLVLTLATALAYRALRQTATSSAANGARPGSTI